MIMSVCVCATRECRPFQFNQLIVVVLLSIGCFSSSIHLFIYRQSLTATEFIHLVRAETRRFAQIATFLRKIWITNDDRTNIQERDEFHRENIQKKRNKKHIDNFLDWNTIQQLRKKASFTFLSWFFIFFLSLVFLFAAANSVLLEYPSIFISKTNIQGEPNLARN